MNFSDDQLLFSMCEEFWYQRQSGVFCDLVIHVQGQTFVAHKSILAARSPYFNELLRSDLVKNEVGIVSGDLTGFENFLKYLYTGKIRIDEENVSELLVLAIDFKVDKLKNYCADYLWVCINTFNCFKFMFLAKTHALYKTLEKIHVFISHHIADICKSEEILNSDFEQFKTFVQEVVPHVPQCHVIDLICKWTSHGCISRENFFADFLPLVNWDCVENQFLENVIKTCTLFKRGSKCSDGLLAFITGNKDRNIQFRSSCDLIKCRNADIKIQNCYSLSNFDDFTFKKTGSAYTVGNANADQLNPDSYNDVIKSEIIDKGGVKTLVKSFLAGKTLNEDAHIDKHLENSTVSLKSGRKLCDTSLDLKVLAEVTEFVSNCKSSDLKRNSMENTSLQNNELSNAIQSNLHLLKFNPNDQQLKHIDLLSDDLKRSNNLTFEGLSSIVTSEEAFLGKPSDNNLPKLSPCPDVNVNPSLLIPASESISVQCPITESNLMITEDVAVIPSLLDQLISAAERLSQNEIPSQNVEKNSLQCIYCPYVGKTMTYLQNHMVFQHSKPAPYSCDICDYSCTWVKDYYGHMKGHLTGPPFRCDHCEKVFKIIRNIINHRFKHTNYFFYQCPMCDFKGRNTSNINYHIESDHTHKKPYQCNFCEKVLKSKTSLNEHVTCLHTNEKNFLCQWCRYATNTRSKLKSHERIHTGNLFYCDFEGCNYSTNRKNQLDRHKVTHSNERPFKCKFCSKSFALKVRLSVHQRIHMKMNSKTIS